MKVLILGEYLFNKEYNTFFRLKHHIKINDWENFIKYIKEYKNYENRK